MRHVSQTWPLWTLCSHRGASWTEGFCGGCARAAQLQAVWFLSFFLSGMPPTLLQAFFLSPFFGSAHHHLFPGLWSELPDSPLALLQSQ